MSALLLLCGACSQEGEIPTPHNDLSGEASTRVSIKDALKRAEKLLNTIEGVSTRSRSVESIEYFGKVNTRSDENASLYYVVNYADNAGFAVLGADSRLDGVYAISEEGHLEVSDTSENEGLRLFFLSLPKTIPPFTKDSLIVDPIIPPGPGQHDDNSYKIEPMLVKNIKYWHQDYPFNLYCPFVTNPQTGDVRIADVGCVPLAVGMMMSYYEWPLSYQNYTFDWTAIKSYDPIIDSSLAGTQYGLPRLLSILGDGDNLNTNYTYSGSGTKMTRYLDYALDNFNYTTPAPFYNFSVAGMERALKEHNPCLMGGTMTSNSQVIGAHAWVVDGIIFDDYIFIPGNSEIADYEIYGEGYLFHCVWGWKGKCNGYFKFDGGLKHNKIFTESDDPAWTEELERLNLLFKDVIYCGGFTPKKSGL